MLRYAFWFLTLPVGILCLTFLYAPSAYAVTGQIQYQSGTTNTNSSLWGDSDDCTTNVCGRATEITPSVDFYACGATTRLAYSGNHSTGSLTLYLYSGGADPDDGTVISSNTISFGDLPTGTDAVVSDTTYFDFGNCQILNAPDTYFFTLVSDSNTTRTLTSAIRNVNNTGWRKMAGWSDSAGASSLEMDLQIYGFTAGSQVVLPTSTLGTYPNYSTSSISICSASSSGFWDAVSVDTIFCNLRYAFQASINWAFFPPASSTGRTVFNSAITSFQDVFPFNLYFSFNNAVSAYSENLDEGTGLTISLPAPFNTNIVLSSTTLNYSTTSTSALETFKTLFGYGIWVATISAIIAIVI